MNNLYELWHALGGVAGIISRIKPLLLITGIVMALGVALTVSGLGPVITKLFAVVDLSIQIPTVSTSMEHLATIGLLIWAGRY